MTSLVKICGLSSADTVEAALSAGADMIGFVRFAPSPRNVSLDLGRDLSTLARGRALRTLLLVDPTDEELDRSVGAIEPDLVQLHGSETPDRLAQIRVRTGRPVMKAIGIAQAADLARIDPYRGVADRILLDAKAPKGAVLPGGNGAAFDWTLLRALADRSGMMLSGGLSPENVAEAIRETGVRAVDVSSGVETRPGEKDPARIAAFVAAAREAFRDRREGATPRAIANGRAA